MLDFDYSYCRSARSVAAIIYGHHIHKFYWGTKETREAGVAKRPDIDIVVNSVSSRSVYSSTLESLTYPQIKVIALIAEGVPERHAREVEGDKPGYFRIDSFRGPHHLFEALPPRFHRSRIKARGYVQRAQQRYNILSLTGGAYEGISIGDSDCKIFVLFGEIGAIEEYRVIDNVKGIIKKLIVTCAIGTCAKMFITEVQFGHAARMANTNVKNRAMRGFEELAHLSSISWLVDLCPCCLKGDERQDKSKFP
ncbi:hypothetical protein AX14_009302 [Amanita brunnescens Koide BX004]|nr:hypothetical protein AX14_009302 [Amanita brunnescens Koide BX004]